MHGMKVMHVHATELNTNWLNYLLILFYSGHGPLNLIVGG